MAYKRNGYRGNRTNSFEEVTSLTSGDGDAVDPIKSELSRKEKRGIKRAQRDLYKAGIVGIGPSTPAIEVESSPAPLGTGTGYSIGNKAIASVAPMPGSMGDGITLIPEPPSKKDPEPNISTFKSGSGESNYKTSKAPTKSKYLRKGKGFRNKDRGRKHGISGKNR